MAKPLVAIVGRPNVGKSTFFNKVVGKKISIVENFPGVTRDRLYADAEWCGRYFTLVDTGGLDVKNKDDFNQSLNVIKKYIKKINTRTLKNRILRGDENAIAEFTKSKIEENKN